MIAEDVDQFYKKVVKDFIQNINKNQYMIRQLQQHNISIHQVQESIIAKIQNTKPLFHQSLHGESTIQQHMRPLFTNIHSIIEQHKHTTHHHTSTYQHDIPHQQQPQQDRPRHIKDQSQHQLENYHAEHQLEEQSIEDDIEGFSNLMDKNKEKQLVKGPRCSSLQKFNCDQDSAKQYRRDSSSQSSLQDCSELNQDYGSMIKKQRQNCRIHMVGTYDTRSKKYNFKSSRTEMQLENVFIKVEGISRQIFLRNISFVCSRKSSQE